MNHITSVGLDVHARSIKACAFNPLTGEVVHRSFAYAPAEVAEWILSLDAPKAVYESGVTGFHLQRQLEALGVDCVIGAVSKMEKPAADRRRKTDRRDAAFLARQLALGTISEVHVPDPACEAARDLSRALADARDDVTAAKQRLSKYLLRNGYVWDETSIRGQRKGAWTRSHWAWIMAIRMAEPAAQETLDYCIDRCRRAIEDKQELEAKVKAHSEEPRWKPAVDALCCLKGIDVVTAFALAVETDGFSRFRSAPAYASWLGIVPSEHSSGDSRHRGGITKSGNKHLRKLLIEASWHCIGASRHEKALRKGQEVAPEVRRHAARGVKRLVDRRAALLGAGKKPVVANCATARELACWAWAIGRMVEAA
jgi:transposase